MKILMSGSSGFIGSRLSPFLLQNGHQVKKLVRHQPANADEIFWDPHHEKVDVNALEGFDAIINLAGDNIAKGRWTEKKKEAILASRVKSTRTLANAIVRLNHPPITFINASAVGYYGNRGDTILTEESSNGTGFLAHVCEKWEEAANPLATTNIRLVLTRFGAVLSPNGGALAALLPAFKLCLGGKIGSGKQYMSWVALEELLGILHHILKTESLSGPINIASPYPVTNETFTKILGKILNRPTLLSMPTFFARLAFGEMADEVLLTSQRTSSQKLLDSGYQFCQPDLELALKQMLSH